jgi:hypothetical protein
MAIERKSLKYVIHYPIVTQQYSLEPFAVMTDPA